MNKEGRTMLMPVEKIAKRKSRVIRGQMYMSITHKMLYISAGVSEIFNADRVQFFVDKQEMYIKAVPADENDNSAFKLSAVNETKGAKRVETNRALESFFKAGFPEGMCGKRLPVKLSLDGSLIADFRPQIMQTYDVRLESRA